MESLKKEFYHRILKPSFRQGMKTAFWLLKLTIPVSFGVFLLDWFGILNEVSRLTDPFFHMLGLSGKASVILITGYFTNIYSVIAVMATLDITLREGLILANMCLIAHSLIVESGIQKKTGSSPWRMVILRLTAGFFTAWLLNIFLPAFSGKIETQPLAVRSGFSEELFLWLWSIVKTSLKIVILVNLLLVIQKILSESGFLKWLEKPFYPLMKLMGLPGRTSFMWLVANTLGLSYGGAIMISETAEGHLDRHSADLLNHHIAVSHSQFEDTLLFAAMGFPVLWLIFPRFVLAIAVVWLRRLELVLRNNMKN